jgi:three-Cys-motif partner protein
MSQTEIANIGRDGIPARSTGTWVHDKKFYFERYLSIFTKGVGPKWNGKLCYVDLFSGPGRSLIRDTGEEVEGSPLIALNCEFAKYVFVDVPDVINSLQKRLAGHLKLQKVSFVRGDCNQVIEAVRTEAPPDHLTLAFVDPTGLQIHFRTIQGLVQDRKVDLLMTIQIGMGIRMNLPQYTQSESNALSEFMDNETWREDVEAGGSPSQIGRRIVHRYLEQLKDIGCGTVENREIEVRSDQNNLLLYFMILASRHRRGHDFWRKTTQRSNPRASAF